MSNTNIYVEQTQRIDRNKFKFFQINVIKVLN